MRNWWAVASLLILACCQSPADSVEARVDRNQLPAEPLQVDAQGRVGGTLRCALLGSPSTFNFALVQELRSVIVTGLTTGTLLEYHRLEKTVVPGVVKDWEISPDAHSIVLHLREGVRFSDGEPLTADDILFTFEKIYEPGSTNPLRDSLIVAGQPLRTRRLDDLTVEIRFAGPYAGIEYILTTVPVFPRHRLQEPGKKLEDYWGLDTPPSEMAGLGPFVVQEHRPGQETVFRYNPHYWRVDRKGVRLPYLDRIVIQYIEDRNAQLLRLQAGDLDLLLDSLRPEDYVQLRQASNVRAINAGPGSRLTFCWFNLSSGVNPETGRPYSAREKQSWFSNLSFRRAVDAAVSRHTIAENVFLGQAQPAFSLVPASIPNWYVPEIETTHDPQRARELLREAGFSWRTRGSREILVDPQGREVQFTLLTISESLWGKIAAIIQQDLEGLGMQIQIKQEELRAAISRIINSRDYDMALLSLDFPSEPVDHVSVLMSDSSMHFWNPKQSEPVTDWEREIDRLMMEQSATLDLEERVRLYTSVQRILAQNVPFIPLINRDILMAGSTRIQNLSPSDISPHAVWNIWEVWLQ